MKAPAMAAEIRTRDAFLAQLARKLEAWVEDVRRPARKVRSSDPARGALLGAVGQLADAARELRIIAEPEAKVPLRVRRLDLGALLAGFLEARRSAFEAHGIEVTIARGGRAIGRFDPALIHTILMELVSNGLKYGGGEPVVVTLRPRRRAVSLCVTSTGRWDGPSARPRRFGRGSARAVHAGYGIGVWLVHRLAEAHGGSVQVHRGRGTVTIAVRLPVLEMRAEVERFVVRITCPRARPTPSPTPAAAPARRGEGRPRA